jgi:hypothetical protein
MSCTPAHCHHVSASSPAAGVPSAIRCGEHAAEDLSAEEFTELKADAKFPGSRYPVNGLLRKVGQHPRGAALLKMLAQVPPLCSFCLSASVSALSGNQLALARDRAMHLADDLKVASEASQGAASACNYLANGQAPLGGRLLYEFHLAPIVSNVTSKLDPADRACIL